MAKKSVHIGSVIGPGVPNRNSFVSVRPRYRFVDGDTINWPDREKYQFENGEVTIPNLEDTYAGEPLVWEFTFENLDTRNQPLAGVRVETVTFEGTSGSTVEYVDMQQVSPAPLPNYEQAAVQQAEAARDDTLAARDEVVAIAGNYVILNSAPSPTELDPGQIGFLIPSPWLPTDLTSLQVWADETLTPPAAGADYGTWYDRSGRANHLTPGTIATYIDDIPQYDATGISGHGCVYHPNSSAMATPIVAWGTAPIVVAAVVKMGAVTAVAQTVWNGQNSGTSAATLLLDRTADGTGWRYRRGGTTITVTHSSASDGLKHVMAVVYNGASSGIYADGVLIGTGDPGSGAVTNLKTGIAQTASGNKNSGTDLRLKQLVAATQVPTTAEIAKLTAFLASKAA